MSKFSCYWGGVGGYEWGVLKQASITAVQKGKGNTSKQGCGPPPPTHSRTYPLLLLAQVVLGHPHDLLRRTTAFDGPGGLRENGVATLGPGSQALHHGPCVLGVLGVCIDVEGGSDELLVERGRRGWRHYCASRPASSQERRLPPQGTLLTYGNSNTRRSPAPSPMPPPTQGPFANHTAAQWPPPGNHTQCSPRYST